MVALSSRITSVSACSGWDGTPWHPPYSMEGAFNDLALSLSRGASEAEVIAAVDRLLAPYGCIGAHGRDEQLSYRFLSDEIAQNRISATYVPAIFLAIVAFLLHMVLSRLVAMQRNQIGLLKAFGYSSGTIGRHYLKMACCAVSGGALAGIVAGWYLGLRLTGLYRDYYRFPLLRYESGPDVAAIALGITFAAALAGAWTAARQAIRLPPAEAMRPELPVAFRSGLFERSGLARISSTTLRMICRNIERRPGKAVPLDGRHRLCRGDPDDRPVLLRLHRADGPDPVRDGPAGGCQHHLHRSTQLKGPPGGGQAARRAARRAVPGGPGPAEERSSQQTYGDHRT